MNRRSKFLSLILGGVLALALAPLAYAQAANPKNSRGEQFFIISSVDQQKHQVVLMAPTQLTIVAALTPQTVYLSEKGQALDVKQMKAGDTVWVTLRSGKDGQVSALKIRQGAMTPEELRALYLHSPSGMATPSSAPARQPGPSPAATPTASGSPKIPAAGPMTPRSGSAINQGMRHAGESHHHHPGAAR